MHAIPNVFIVEPANQGWIIERLMRDIAVELRGRGVPTRIGPSEAYDGEAVLFNSRYLTPLFEPRARINSLFITHVDDSFKEHELRSAGLRFNSLVCMSPQDADFVSGLLGRPQGVIGIDLPTRDIGVRPLRVALFSACYKDGRKNEAWIQEYFQGRSRDVRDTFVLCFLGWGWEQFCTGLAALDLNYEVIRYSRTLPGEYGLYKQQLPTMDVLIYPGFDGGAMSVYDGLSAGLEILASDVSYHRGLGDSVTLFVDRAGFFKEMDRLHARHRGRADALRARSISCYVDRLLAHWNGLLDPDGVAAETPVPAGSQQTLDLFRGRYKPLSLSRLRSALIRMLQKRLLK